MLRRTKEFLKDNGLLIYILIISIVLAIVIIYLNSYESYLMTISNIRDYIEANNINAIIFGLLFILLALLGVSIILLSILTGIMFSFAKALTIAILGVNIASFIAFSISRYATQRLKKKDIGIGRFKGYKERINKSISTYDIKSLIIIKFIIPAIPFSYGAGLIKRITLKNFSYATLIQNTFIVVVVTYFGFSTAKNIFFYISAVLAILIVMVITYNLTKKKKKIDINSK